MTTTHLNDLFDQMDEEKGNKLDDKIQIEVSEPTIIEKLYENYMHFINDFQIGEGLPISTVLKDISSKDITNLSIRLDSLCENKPIKHIGYYISTLINKSKDKNHFLFFEKSERNIKYIGFRNKEKNIYIKGNNLNHTGSYMISGKIIIDGDSTPFIGSKMLGGKIIVKGDSGRYAGNQMKRGEIIVTGKVNQDFSYLNYTKNEQGETIITRKS